MAEPFLRQRGKKRLYTLVWKEGRQQRSRSLHTTDAAYAKYCLKEKRRELAAHPDRQAPSALTIQEAVERYLESTSSKRSPGGMISQRTKLHVFCRAVGAERLATLSPGQIEDVLGRLQQTRKLNAVTRNEYLASLRALSRWCVFRGYRFEDFTTGIPMLAEIEREPTALTREQRDRLVEVARPHPLYPLVVTACYTGLRWGELATLEWSDVDLDRKIVTVRPKAHWTPKSKRSRQVPLHALLRALLADWRRAAGPCFPIVNGHHHVGSAYTARARYGITTLLEQIGAYQKGEGWHLLRRTFASLLLQAKVPLEKVMRWLGHSKGGLPEPTWRYVRWIEGYDAEIEKL